MHTRSADCGPSGCVPYVVFTPEELEAHDREVALEAYNAAGMWTVEEKDFETYWNERLKENHEKESK